MKKGYMSSSCNKLRVKSVAVIESIRSRLKSRDAVAVFSTVASDEFHENHITGWCLNNINEAQDSFIALIKMFDLFNLRKGLSLTALISF